MDNAKTKLEILPKNIFGLFFVFTLIVAGSLFFIKSATSTTAKTWDFSTSSDYTYDNTKIEFSSGQAQLKATSSPAWYNTSWKYRKAITVDNTGNGNTLTDYQVKISLTSSNFDFSKAQSAGQDIRFSDSNGTTLVYYWIESYDAVGQTATIWVKIPSITASSQKTVYLYYGNSLANDASDGTNSFTYFNDFSNPGSASITNSSVDTLIYQGVALSGGTSGAWDFHIRGEPGNVLYDPVNPLGGSYVMAYTGYPGTYSMGGQTKLGIATSSDRIHWTKYSGNPVITNYIEDPSLVKSGSTYYLYGEDSPNINVILYTSTDLVNWAYQGIVVPPTPSSWDSSWVGSPQVNIEGSTWYLFYEGYNGSGTAKMGLATSTDGISWTKSTSNPIFGSTNTTWANGNLTPNDNIFKENGVYYNIYDAFIGSNYGCGVATSTDLIHWTDRGSSPLLANFSNFVLNGGTDLLITTPPSASADYEKALWLAYPAVSSDLGFEQVNNVPMSISSGVLNLLLPPGTAVHSYVRTKNSFTPPYVVEEKWKYDICGTGGLCFEATSDTNNEIADFWGISGGAWIFASGGSWSGPSPTAGTWYRSKITVQSTRLDISTNNGAITGSKTGLTVPAHKLMIIGSGNPGDISADFIFVHQYTATEPTVTVGSEGVNYSSANPIITPIISTAEVFTSLSGFSETANKNGGEIKYQISNDGGTTWYWYNSGWITTTSDYTESNTVSNINTNIATFPVESGSFLFKAYLHSDGSQLVQLDSVVLTYVIDSEAPSTPTATPSAGTYNATQSVTLSATGSDYIKYSLTETPATCSAGTLYSDSTPISIATSQTIYVRACDNAGNSSTQSFAYIIDSEAPSTAIATPSADTYNSTQSVTLTATGSDYIKYSLTETPATCSAGTLYSDSTPISIATSQTIYALACDNAGNSSTQSFAYIIDSEAPSTAIATPVAGTYSTTQSITLTSAGSDSIRYSITETPATCSAGTLYTTPISVSTSQTIYVRACDTLNNSSTTNFAYVISRPTSSGSSALSRYNNLIAMGNTEAAQELQQQYPNQITPTPVVTPPTQTTSIITPESSTLIIINRILKLVTPRIWGDDVKVLQTFLNTKGYNSGIPDGNFGPKTQTAVIAFQKANGLTPDGIVGPNTIKFMNDSQTTPSVLTLSKTRILKLSTPRMIGDDVLALQTYLSTNGYDVGIPDGIFGYKTQSAVIAFQTANGLTTDGIVGPLTRGEMNK